MIEALSIDFFQKNRNKLIAKLKKDGVVVISGNGLVQRTGDTNYPFRQDSNFYYLTGIIEPSAYLVIDLRSNSSFVAMQIREGIRSIFDGSQDVKKLLDISGVDEILSIEEGWDRLKNLLHKRVYTLTPKDGDGEKGNVNYFVARTHSNLINLPESEIIDISREISELRVIKTQEEIKLIERAVMITKNALKEVELALSSFSNEKEIEALITKQFLLDGAQGHAYQPIIASGLASCTLHYIDNNKPLVKDGSLLIDVGAEVLNYAADISRTLIIGKIDEQQKIILDGVKKIQKDLIAELKPGMYFSQLSELAYDMTERLLVYVGLISKIHSKADVYRYFPHAVSHFLGLDVHDVGDYSAQLAENMVITIEPGIYWHEKSFGVRIEDDVLITKNGARILGNNV